MSHTSIIKQGLFHISVIWICKHSFRLFIWNTSWRLVTFLDNSFTKVNTFLNNSWIKCLCTSECILKLKAVRISIVKTVDIVRLNEGRYAFVLDLSEENIARNVIIFRVFFTHKCLKNSFKIFIISACNRVMDVVFVIDTSGSAQSDVVTNRTVALVREMASFFPLEATKFSVVTFGNYARINFLLRSFNNSQDLMDSLVFKMSVGPQFLGTAIGFLGNSSTVEGPHIFATRNGGRPSSAKVAVIVTSSDSPYEYRDIVQVRINDAGIYLTKCIKWCSWSGYKNLFLSDSFKWCLCET